MADEGGVEAEKSGGNYGKKLSKGQREQELAIKGGVQDQIADNIRKLDEARDGRAYRSQSPRGTGSARG